MLNSDFNDHLTAPNSYSLLYICHPQKIRMAITFYKYQGTGNDFVMIDNRDLIFSKNDTKLIHRLCDRKFGIGADGLILLEKPEDDSTDFTMVYYNSDGNPSSMCGNGGRCLVAFAKFLGVIESEAKFMAVDGLHEARIDENDIVSLKMIDVSKIDVFEDHVFLDTGSPHHVSFGKGLQNKDIKRDGAAIRYSEIYSNGGTNVNFVEHLKDEEFAVRTYERGVEDETLSCGTGVTAVAISAKEKGLVDGNSVKLKTMGGMLEVKFEKTPSGYQNVWLIGPAQQVFKGAIQ